MLKMYIEKIILVIGFIFILSLSYAEEIDNSEMYVEKEFLIIYSAKNYNEALRVCKDNKKTGLSFSKETLENSGMEFPWYFPRGRYDDGKYLSIEYSNGYSEFAKGYYIVIAESGEKGSMKIT